MRLLLYKNSHDLAPNRNITHQTGIPNDIKPITSTAASRLVQIFSRSDILARNSHLIATFMRFSVLRKPTVPLSLLRTVLMITTFASSPWKLSLDRELVQTRECQHRDGLHRSSSEHSSHFNFDFSISSNCCWIQKLFIDQGFTVDFI